MRRDEVGICPECSLPVIETPGAYACSGSGNGCKFEIREDVLERLGKKTISGSEAKQLLSGKKLKVEGLKGSNGKIFDAEWEVQK